MKPGTKRPGQFRGYSSSNSSCSDSCGNGKNKRFKLDQECENPKLCSSAAGTELSLGFSWDCNMSESCFFHKPKLGLCVDYYPKFFKQLDARTILRQLEQELPPYLEASKNEVKIMGKMHKIPRKQTAFGDSGLLYKFSGVVVAANPWIPILKEMCDMLRVSLREQFNFVLVNRYKDGNDHMGEHRDDEEDLVLKSPIASVSFGQKRDFVFRHKDSRGRNAPRKDIDPLKLCLEHGSLLVMRYPTNSYWYHSLPTRKSAPGPRINLTFRTMKLCCHHR